MRLNAWNRPLVCCVHRSTSCWYSWTRSQGAQTSGVKSKPNTVRLARWPAERTIVCTKGPWVDAVPTFALQVDRGRPTRSSCTAVSGHDADAPVEGPGGVLPPPFLLQYGGPPPPVASFSHPGVMLPVTTGVSQNGQDGSTAAPDAVARAPPSVASRVRVNKKQTTLEKYHQ